MAQRLQVPEHDSNLLLSTQIAQILLERIRDGVYQPTTRLPGELELCEAFNVSRPTVRRALKTLEDMNLIIRKRPKGTFVNELPAAFPQIAKSPFAFSSARVQETEKKPLLQVAMEEALTDLYQKSYFADFSAQTNCSVEMIHWNSWYAAVESIVSMYAQHRMPDIFSASNDTVGTFARMGILRALDDFIEPGELKRIKERCARYGLGSYVYGGKLYGYPFFSESRLLIYRKDHFANAGIPDPLEFPLTHDSFVEVGKKLSNPHSGLYAFAYPVAHEPLTIQSAMTWIIQRGGSLLRIENGRIVPATEEPEFVEALSWYVDLQLKHKICPPDLSALSFSNMVHRLRNGAISMIIGTPNTYKFLVDSSSDSRYGYAPFPTGPVNNFTFMGGMPLCISSSSKTPELAWQLISYMNTWDVLSSYCARTSSLLPIECYDIDTIRANTQPEFRIAADTLQTAVPYTYPVGYNDCLDFINTGFWEIPMAQILEMLLRGEIDVKNACKFLSVSLRAFPHMGR